MNNTNMDSIGDKTDSQDVNDSSYTFMEDDSTAIIDKTYKDKTDADTMPQEQFAEMLSNIQRNLRKYSLFSILKHLEDTQNITSYLIGDSNRPSQESIRLHQNPNLTFNYRNVDTVEFKANRLYVAINSVGLLGTNSVLPSHLIEYVYQRQHQYGDRSWAAFINMLQHRLLTMFYRSWRNAQSIASLTIQNRAGIKGEDRFSRYIASLAGLWGFKSNETNQYVDYYSKLYFTGYYLQGKKSKAGFESLISQYFRLPITVKQNIGYWFDLPKEEQTQLGNRLQYRLGDGLVLGERIYDVQNKFRLIIGPLDLTQYQSFFRGSRNAKKLQEWVRLYFGCEYEWDTQLILDKNEAAAAALDATKQLGLTTFLGEVANHVDDLIIDYNLR